MINNKAIGIITLSPSRLEGCSRIPRDRTSAALSILPGGGEFSIRNFPAGQFSRNVVRGEGRCAPISRPICRGVEADGTSIVPKQYRSLGESEPTTPENLLDAINSTTYRREISPVK